MHFRFVVLVSSLVALSALAQTGVPGTLGYQGRVLRADGTPETGIATIRFALFDATTSGTALGCEAHTVGLSDGFYSLELGTGTTCGTFGQPWSTSMFDGRDLYLELTINGSVLTPRLHVGSVAYAVKAATADLSTKALTAVHLDGGIVNASSISVNGAQVIDAAGHLVGPAVLAGTAPIVVSGNSVSLQGCSSSGQTLSWSGTAWACAPPVTGGSCPTDGVMTGISSAGAPLCAHIEVAACEGATACTPTCAGTILGTTKCLTDSSGRNLCTAICRTP